MKHLDGLYYVDINLFGWSFLERQGFVGFCKTLGNQSSIDWYEKFNIQFIDFTRLLMYVNLLYV